MVNDTDNSAKIILKTKLLQKHAIFATRNL